MKKIILFIVMAILLLNIAFAATFIRTVPATAEPGSTFQVTYTTTDASGNWGVLIEDTIGGGCICVGCTNPNKISTGWLSPSMSQTIPIQAPASGTCTFTSGVYDFASTTTNSGTFTDATVAISGGSCTPNWQTGTWSACSSSCTRTRTVTDANNCGVLTNKPATSESCTGDACVAGCTYSAWTPSTSTKCTNETVTQTRTVLTGTGCAEALSQTVAGTNPCGTATTCEFWQQLDSGTCKMSKLVIGIIIFFVAMFALAMFK